MKKKNSDGSFLEDEQQDDFSGSEMEKKGESKCKQSNFISSPFLLFSVDPR